MPRGTTSQGAPARTVNVSSMGQAPIDFDGLMLERDFDGVCFDQLSDAIAHAQAYDAAARRRLWAISAELTGVGVQAG